MVGEAQRYLGMTQGGEEPTDWLNVACQLDEDGNYIAPMRAAIAKIHQTRPKAGAILARLVVEFCDEAEALAGYVDEDLGDFLSEALLDRLYDTYIVRPMRTRQRGSLAS